MTTKTKTDRKIPYDFDGAYQIIEKIKDFGDKLSVYTAIIAAHIESDNSDIAEQVAAKSLRLLKQWDTTKQISLNYSKTYHIERIVIQFPHFKDKKLPIEFIREDEAAADKIKDVEFRCCEYLKNARRAYGHGEIKLAEEMLGKAEKAVTDIRHDKQKTGSLVNIARLWHEKGNRKKMEATIQSAVSICEKMKNPNEPLFQISLLYLEDGEFRRGIDLLQRVKGKQAVHLENALIRQIPNLMKAGFKNDIVSIIELRNDKKAKEDERVKREFSLANAYWEAGDHDTSNEIVDKIRQDCDITQESFPFYLLFRHMLLQNKFAEAERVLDSAQRPQEHFVSFLFELAACHFDRGNKPETKRLIERAEKAVEKIKDAKSQHDLFLCIAACWARFGDKVAAKQAFEKAGQSYLEGSDGLLKATVAIGFYQWHFGFMDDAKKTVQKSVKLARSIPTAKAVHYSGVVDLLLRLNDTKTARALFDEIMAMIEKEGNEKGNWDNNLMNFGLGLVCRKNDHQHSDPMKVLTNQH